MQKSSLNCNVLTVRRIGKSAKMSENSIFRAEIFLQENIARKMLKKEENNDFRDIISTFASKIS